MSLASPPIRHPRLISPEPPILASYAASFNAGAPLEQPGIAVFLAAYLARLDTRLQSLQDRRQPLSGVPDLLRILATEPATHLGLLTGNVRAGAMLKLSNFGLHDIFADGAFGDDNEDPQRPRPRRRPAHGGP